VLRRADVLVFVADSQADRLEDNIASWQDMERQLERRRRPIHTMPLVVQFNKRDLPDILPPATLKEALNVGTAPCFEAIAIRSKGVPETLQTAIRFAMIYAQHKLQQT
jgi:hypothetical protein